jgi:ABC-type multidrug transport system fused ATPase/permease subunit
MTSTTDSSIRIHGKIALVSQDAFILNETLRENILFGREFHRELYERVLDCCCLRSDIENFGDARDYAVIGERGITLSGGKDVFHVAKSNNG